MSRLYAIYAIYAFASPYLARTGMRSEPSLGCARGYSGPSPYATWLPDQGERRLEVKQDCGESSRQLRAHLCCCSRRRRHSGHAYASAAGCPAMVRRLWLLPQPRTLRQCSE